MAIKTTIGPKGVVSEKIGGTQDKLFVNVDEPREDIRNVVSASGTVSLTGGATMLLARTANVTASLPSLGSEEEGNRVLILLDGQGNNVVEVTGSAGALSIDGGVTAAVSGAHGHLELVGVKANDDGGFLWHVLDQKPAL